MVTTYCGEHFVIYVIVESLCYTPEINIILHIIYTSILKMTSTMSSGKEERGMANMRCLVLLAENFMISMMIVT